MRILKELNWRVFFILLGAGLLGVVAILPYMADVLKTLPIGEEQLEMPFSVVLGLALIQNGILLSIAIFFGIVLSERVGFRMPLIHGWTSGASGTQWKGIVVTGLLTGAAAGAIIVAIEVLVFLRDLPASMLPLFDIPLWKRLLSGVFYGGITEELFMRMFLLSLVAWLFGKWWKAPDGAPAKGAIGMAIVIVAILFGLGHLPATATMAPLTQTLVVRALLLNGVAGIAFGLLYWKRGLEAAMLGHMGAHLVMQIPGVMLIRSMV